MRISKFSYICIYVYLNMLYNLNIEEKGSVYQYEYYRYK